MTINKEQAVSDAVEQLRNHQVQLDADGVMVGVSRQAVDEVLVYLDAIAASHPLEQQQAALAVAAEIDAIDAEWENVSALAMPCRDEFRQQSAERIARAALTASGMGRMRSALVALASETHEMKPDAVRAIARTALQDNDGGMEGG